MTDTQKIVAEFDRKFVKDCGPDVEPIFKDANGSVGPIRRFITTSIQQAEQEGYKRGVKAVELPTIDHSKCPMKESCIGYQNAESDLENIKEALSSLDKPLTDNKDI